MATAVRTSFGSPLLRVTKEELEELLANVGRQEERK